MTAVAREQVPRAIAFVDLAGFTALTDAHGDERAVDTQQGFLAVMRAELGPAVECVKHLGDGALLAAVAPAPLLTCLVGLARRWAGDPHAPLLRAGVHAGAVLRLDTDHGVDYLGGVVNTAARLCERAAGGQVVLGAALIGAAVEAGLHPQAMGELALRGLAEPVAAYSADLTELDVAPVDPVCRMPVPHGSERAVLHHLEQRWTFCSLGCSARFAADPSPYLHGLGLPSLGNPGGMSTVPGLSA